MVSFWCRSAARSSRTWLTLPWRLASGGETRRGCVRRGRVARGYRVRSTWLGGSDRGRGDPAGVRNSDRGVSNLKVSNMVELSSGVKDISYRREHVMDWLSVSMTPPSPLPAPR